MLRPLWLIICLIISFTFLPLPFSSFAETQEDPIVIKKKIQSFEEQKGLSWQRYLNQKNDLQKRTEAYLNKLGDSPANRAKRVQVVRELQRRQELLRDAVQRKIKFLEAEREKLLIELKAARQQQGAATREKDGGKSTKTSPAGDKHE